MRYLLLVPVLVMFTLADLNGQSDELYETIQYADGSFFIGHAVEENEHQVQFALRSTEDIITLDKILIIKWINSKDNFIFKGGRYHKKKGKFSKIDYAFGGNINDGSVQLSYIRGKLLQPRLGVGLGIGVSSSSASSVTLSSLTFGEVFAYGKYYLNDNRRRLFLDGKAGVAIALESDDWLSYTSGPLLQPGIGFEFARSKKCRWSIKLSQLLQYSVIRPNEIRNDFFGRTINVVDKRLFNRTVLGFGLHF